MGEGGQLPVNGPSDELLLGSSSKGTFTLLSTFAYKVKAEKTCFTLIVSSFIMGVNAGPGGPPASPFTRLHNTVALSKRLALNLLPSICRKPPGGSAQDYAALLQHPRCVNQKGCSLFYMWSLERKNTITAIN